MSSFFGDLERRPAPSEPASMKLMNTLIDHVDVTVETLIGGASISIAELNALKPGAVLPLDAGLNDFVEVRVNGAIIAYGELVAVGDRYGVRISAIAP